MQHDGRGSQRGLKEEKHESATTVKAGSRWHRSRRGVEANFRFTLARVFFSMNFDRDLVNYV